MARLHPALCRTFALTLLLPAVAPAQAAGAQASGAQATGAPPAAAAAVAPTITPRARELAQQFVTASGADPRGAEAGDATLADAWAAVQRADPGAKPELRSVSDQATRDEMKAFAEKLYAGEVEIYASHFTEQQLTDLIAFYKSPSGMAFSRETRAINQERNQLSRRLSGEILYRVVMNFCAKAACPSPTPATAAAAH